MGMEWQKFVMGNTPVYPRDTSIFRVREWPSAFSEKKEAQMRVQLRVGLFIAFRSRGCLAWLLGMSVARAPDTFFFLA